MPVPAAENCSVSLGAAWPQDPAWPFHPSGRVVGTATGVLWARCYAGIEVHPKNISCPSQHLGNPQHSMAQLADSTLNDPMGAECR